MIRLRFVCITAAAAVAALASGSAIAGWGSTGGSHGSSGGSYGAYGSYSSHGSTGGSSGYAAYSSYAAHSSYGSSGASYGSSGGASSGGDSGHVGPLRRLFARLHDHHAARKAARHAAHASSGGSSGYASYSSTGGSSGYGSSGGSSGYASYSYGSYGSSGGHGSSGGAYPAYQPGVIDGGYYSPGAGVEGTYEGGATPQPQGGEEAAGENPPPPPAAEARLGRDAALLTVAVPESARVLVNGNPTTSKGPIRQFMSRGLKAGHSYTYVVEVQDTVDGRPVSDHKTVRLRAGDAERLVFDLPSSESAATETALTLHVPADAKVTLAGNPTAVTGETRTFRTRQLSANQSWDDYTIQVAVVRDGRQLTQEKKIRLQGGADQQLTFDFEQDQVALASR